MDTISFIDSIFKNVYKFLRYFKSYYTSFILFKLFVVVFFLILCIYFLLIANIPAKT